MRKSHRDGSGGGSTGWAQAGSARANKKGRPLRTAPRLFVERAPLERTVVQADEEATAVGIEVRIERRSQVGRLFRIEGVDHAGPQRQVVPDVPAHGEVVTREVAGVELVV